MNARLEEFLAAHLAEYEVIPHPEAFTAQEHAAATHVPGNAWAKAVILKKPDGFAMAVLPACCTIDLTRLKGLMGESDVGLASVEEILAAVPGCDPGAIPPFGPLSGMPTYVDRSLTDQTELTMAAGDRHTALRMRAAEFARLAAARVGEFALHEAPPGSTPRR